jgi:hypothetical protein
VLRVASVARQDIGTEGTIMAYMNRKYYIQFLFKELASKYKDHSILQKNLYIVLRSSEMIASFRLLSIIHVAIVLPRRWLTGNVHLLAADDVGIIDMAEVAQLIHNALDEIASDGQLVLDQDFILDILDPIKEQVPAFKEYMEFMLEEHTCFGVGSRLEVNKSYYMMSYWLSYFIRHTGRTLKQMT